MITDQLRGLQAERALATAQLEKERKAQAVAERRWERISKVLLARIDRAAPFIDEGCPPDKWPPSVLLKILWCVTRAGPRDESPNDGAQAVLDMLDIARERFKEGLHPNPFLGPPPQGA